MAYAQKGWCDKSLTDAEVEEYREHARQHAPDLSHWTTYHPVCRQVWLAQGFRPTAITSFRGYVDDNGAVDVR